MSGFFSWLGNYFLDPRLLYTLLLLIPFILLYFIRPKPRHEVIPTLMFLFRDLGKNRKTAFLRRLVHDLLFLLQLLILLLLIFAMAKPYINLPRDAWFKNSVIVLDVSASMQAEYSGGKSRFEEAVSIARKNLGASNTLILVKKVNEVVLVDRSAGEVRDFLSSLKPVDTPTALYDAISIAGGYANHDSRVVVISDFIDTETTSDLGVAKKALESQGIKVDFVKVYSPVKNIGIVDLSITSDRTVATIRNYHDEDSMIKVKVNDLEENINVPGDSQELFSFSTPAGTSKIELQALGFKDGFLADNSVFISTPSDIVKKALLITNNPSPSRTYVFNAFDTMKSLSIEVAVPPKIPDLSGYDLFIFKDLNPSLILPGAFSGVKSEVEKKGKAVIIYSQKDLQSVEYYGLLPFIIEEPLSRTANILPGSGASLAENIDFGITKKYFSLKPVEGFNVVVIAAADDNTPLITFNSLGQGKAFYYGILDEDKDADASFAKSPGYFVFWKRTADFALGIPGINELNFKSGSILNLNEEQRIITPEGRVTAKSLRLETTGLYTLNDRVIAINLLNDKESDINSKGSLDEEKLFQYGDRFKSLAPFELTNYLVILIIILLLVELLYIKLRGDL